MITLPAQTAASVPLPAAGYQRLFLDSVDMILKTKDSAGNVRPFGVGTATDLAVTPGPNGPVAIDGGASPEVGYMLVCTAGPGSPTADWLPVLTGVTQTAIQSGPIALTGDVGELVRADITGGNATHALPSAATPDYVNRQIEYKIIGLASGNSVTITPNLLETIDGVNAPIVMNTDNEYMVLRSDGAGWMVMV